MKKLINLSDQQVKRIKEDANIREISFTEMVKRIFDRYYEEKDKKNNETNL